MKTVEQILREEHAIWNMMLMNKLAEPTPNRLNDKIDVEILSLRVDTLRRVIEQVEARKID